MRVTNGVYLEKSELILRAIGSAEFPPSARRSDPFGLDDFKVFFGGQFFYFLSFQFHHFSFSGFGFLCSAK
jgi:hypothetical protein